MAKPVILVVDSDPAGLATVEGELLDRYAPHYAVVCVGSATDARPAGSLSTTRMTGFAMG